MQKLSIIGLGDVARRALPLLGDWQVDATRFDLDGIIHDLPTADAVLYTVPPPTTGQVDTRLANLLAFWSQNASAPRHFVYISTTGVYGDCAGEWVDETAPIQPQSARAIRRADAEQQLQKFATQHPMRLTILRAPGIYAMERLPLQRIHDGVPILHDAQDAYSNHIHADDLAQMCVAALNAPCGIRIYNACDDAPLKMGDWFTALAQRFNLPVPPRVSRDELRAVVSDMQWSFVRESRRLSNAAIKRELNITLRYPSALDFLQAPNPTTPR